MESPQAEAGQPAIPTHVAIIMDGNGRWARSRGLPRIAGHRKGADAVRRTLKASVEFGISYLTLFGFSSENWKRPVDEVEDLMGLLRRYVQSEIAELHEANVRVRMIGDRAALAPDIVSLIQGAEDRTRNNTGLNFTVALSYGSRQEIVSAVRDLAENVRAGRLDPADITDEMIGEHLAAPDIPDPDLLIRTSGEQRLSNFLLWQSAYTEFVFTDVLWPDFGREHLGQALAEYSRRERRYGACVG